jgi:hypothetical protein
MTDIDRAFRDAEQMPVQDLWPDIVTRTPGEPPFRSPGPRAKAVVVAVAVAILGIGFLLRAFSEGSTQPATRITSPPVSHPPPVYEADGKIVVTEEDGSGLPLTRGYSPTLSPDGTTIAFLRDPGDPHIKNGPPYVLQAWLVNADGSDLRKVGQQRGCCVAIRGSVDWSKDGSSIVLSGTHEQTIDVATADLSRVYESMGSGYSPKLSPDGTTIAFLRDPSYDPPNWNGPPFVLQVWLINADGSGAPRKLAQLPGCCIVISGDLHWSKDGSSIVLIADGQRRFDVTTGRRLPMRSSTG